MEHVHANGLDAKAGGAMYGPDANKWPAWWADAVETLTKEHGYANAIQGIKT